MINRHRQIKKNLILRAKIIQAIRDFFTSTDFLEVETPVRIPAPTPEPYISALASDGWYLQTSPELNMKRLLCAGYPKIFQICKCFRKNERGSRHLTEFTMLEWYEADTTYLHLMTQCERLIHYVHQSLNLPGPMIYQDFKIDLDPPWPRISLAEAFDRFSGTNMDDAILKDAFDETISFDIEPQLGVSQPVFLYDFPAARSPLAASKPENPDLAQRMELYIGGLELCNGFTELNDPVVQRKRFEEELAARKKRGQPVYPMPEKFLSALEFMPQASGNAFGIDRLVMLFTNAKAIDEVAAFIPEEL